MHKGVIGNLFRECLLPFISLPSFYSSPSLILSLPFRLKSTGEHSFNRKRILDVRYAEPREHVWWLQMFYVYLIKSEN